VRRFIAMRYQGQNYEQEVAVPEGIVEDAALAAVYAEYGRLYEGFYGYRLDGIPIELVRLSVVAMGEPPVFTGLPSEEAEGDAPERRDVFFPGSGFVSTEIVRRPHLATGERRPGPLIVESMDSTVVVPPGWTLSVASSGILDLTRA
jgi:N-methylhydantoinase A